MCEISVVICTHNPRPDYFTRVLEALYVQTLPKDRWEILLVDNASDDQLEMVWNLSLHPNARHIREEKLGLTPARLRGIAESSAELLVFVDDDNILSEDYLEKALGLMVDFPRLGAFGAGVIEGEFESPPRKDVEPYVMLLAIRTLEADSWSNFPENNSSVPWGAGMCIRRSVAAKYAKAVTSSNTRQSLDRKKNALLSCGDMDMAFFACDAGMGMGNFRELSLIHLIPNRRLTPEYIIDITKGHAASHYVLSKLWNYKSVRDENRIARMLRHWRNLVRLRGMERSLYFARRDGVALGRQLLKETA